MSIERASGLAEAIRKAFVLLDINLPDTDGLEVLKRIMAIPAPKIRHNGHHNGNFYYALTILSHNCLD